MKVHFSNKLQYGSFVLISLLLIIGAFFAGMNVGESKIPAIEKVTAVVNKEPVTEEKTVANFDPFWKVWNTLNEKSIYAHKITDQEKVWGAAEGLASSLGDPYTVFFGPQENKLFHDEIRGNFGGIGAEVGLKDKVLTVVAPLKGTPADKAGLKSGDKLIKIGKVDTTDMTIDTAINLIRGEKGTPVLLTIFRPGEKETKEISIIRDTIEIPTIDTELRKDGIFVIHFYSFSENSAMLFKGALQKFKESKTDKLIIDVRGNPGGYLDQAIQITSWFLDQGLPIVRENFGENKKEQVYRSYGPRLFTDDLKLIVLMDGGSASASEIFAGAIQEHHIGKLVGEKSFGKGSVQELVKITDDTSLKVTIAKWLTPNGISISEQGLTPDVKVSVGKNDNKEHDTQLETAATLLINQ